MTSERIESIIDLIIDDIQGRSGLGSEWDAIDDDIRDEIRAEWFNIINEGAN